MQQLPAKSSLYLTVDSLCITAHAQVVNIFLMNEKKGNTQKIGNYVNFSVSGGICGVFA